MCQLKKYLSIVLMAMFVALLSSCSGNDYLNVIPSNSIALISLDVRQMGEESKLDDKAGMLKSMLHVDDVADCGIDIMQKIYLFESADGNLGMCAKVADSDDMQAWLNGLAKQGICQPLTERKDCHFTVLKDSWLVGFSDEALLVMGPVVAEAQAELQRQMTKYLNADEEAGIKGTPMFGRLDSIPTSMAMVAQVKALPEKFVAPFTFGAPKGSDASQIMIAAEMEQSDGLFHISGETFSFNKNVDAALKQAAKVYRPIKGTYVKSMPADALAGIFMNVNGKDFLPMLQSNKGLQALLMGINTAIDMDNIIRSVDGDMSIVLSSMSDNEIKMMMGAQLGHSGWLADVDYWKQSCPKGSAIGNWGKNAFCYSDGKTSFYFGVTDDRQFFSGTEESMAENVIKPSVHPVPVSVQKAVEGQKMAMVLNLSQTGGSSEVVATVTSLLTPIFGNINSIVYTLK